jgi:hypothetical protein
MARQAEGRDRLGRYYNYPSLAAVREIFQPAAPWFSLEIERSSGQGYDGAAVKWLNCTATKNERLPNAGTFAGAACLPTYRHAS